MNSLKPNFTPDIHDFNSNGKQLLGEAEEELVREFERITFSVHSQAQSDKVSFDVIY